MKTKTKHQIFYKDARKMNFIDSKSVNLVVTSPPYPMIAMWDNIFSKNNNLIKKALDNKDGKMAFELMHKELDKVWNETYRVLKDGGIACINIGDAVRTVNGDFQLFPNHSRILNHCLKIGFTALPTIIWRKQTNAPNKFMGSGTLPVGAYVTLEHEFILILRKNGKKIFLSEKDKKMRRESSFFWEERNNWFSDVWLDVKGTNQKIISKDLRNRSAAFPFEIAYRLISMYSVKHDLILDPFLGTGTTTFAAMASERNSVGFEIDKNFERPILLFLKNMIPFANQFINERLKRHKYFIKQRGSQKKNIKYTNKNHTFGVVTGNEVDILIKNPLKYKKVKKNIYEIEYL